MFGIFNKLFLTLKQLATNLNHCYLLNFSRTQTLLTRLIILLLRLRWYSRLLHHFFFCCIIQYQVIRYKAQCWKSSFPFWKRVRDITIFWNEHWPSCIMITMSCWCENSSATCEYYLSMYFIWLCDTPHPSTPHPTLLLLLLRSCYVIER